MVSTVLTIATILLHFGVVIALSLRVIMRKPPVGVALAWLFLIAALPLAGVTFYLLVGERRVGQGRARRIDQVRADYERLARAAIAEGLTDVDWTNHRPEARGMDRLGRSLIGIPTVAGSDGKAFIDAQDTLCALAADIDAARKSVLMEFYIWNAGGTADEVLEALIRAAQRGVACRVLVDAIGGRPWWKSDQPGRLRAAGVDVRPALPAGIWQMLFSRNDLRLHRKIVVIDNHVAWTGSMNLVDPRYFKQDAHVGEWVDAMLRIEGAIVSPLTMTVIADWMLETGETLEEILAGSDIKLVQPKGNSDVQVVPSGPVETGDGLLQMVLAVVNSAREELVLTTPYFIPDESLMRALCGAAGRGVEVHLIVPERVDSTLTRYASRSYFEELMAAGTHIHLYRKGLLHTKSITADRSISMFGTANLDMRSLWLNYEVSLFIYGRDAGELLHALQQRYLNDSLPLDPDNWRQRPFRERVLENTLRLMSPVL
jgi:cardiolipin synthase A/B